MTRLHSFQQSVNLVGAAFAICLGIAQVVSLPPSRAASHLRVAQADQPEVLLVCQLTIADGSRSPDVALRLNSKARTVNGLPAEFTDAEITWSTDDNQVRTKLNRFTGRIFAADFGGSGRVFTGICQRAVNRQF